MSDTWKTVEALAGMLQHALETKLGREAPILIYVKGVGGELYDVEVQVNPKGDLGPGSVLLIPKQG